MSVIFEDNLWETDYILGDILPQMEVNLVSHQNLEKANTSHDVFVFSSRGHNFWNIRKTIQTIKPKIIIMLSDEFYQENLYHYNTLGLECDLFLRNYHHQYYNYTPNTIVFPLGYTNECEKFILPKKYDWSFVGEIKNDREEMLNTFSQLSNHYVSTNLPKREMCEVYSQSHFVPCGRGNSSLDCFRLYESSMNGAIPVVVGSKEEIQTTFKYEENPPWIFAETWGDAHNMCKTLLSDSEKLREMQKNVLEWWDKRIFKVKNKVLEVL